MREIGHDIYYYILGTITNINKLKEVNNSKL
jgi:hypothetical protein